ncbi:MAG TPA: hypothetical protein VGQ36_12860 [Thermoanaerobaculia bacterium]|nr:hypothetical protein [Thermoanaerobaculia bacterium]
MAIVLLFATNLLIAQERKPAQPNVTPPITPKESDQDLRKLPLSKPWKPGDPVREMPDLRQSGSEPRRVTGGPHTLIVVNGTFTVQSTRNVDPEGPFAFESLWTEDRCAASSTQELRVLYDERAKRWLLGRWASLAPDSAFHYCVALSRTSDPVSGGWFLYDYPLPMYRAGSSIDATGDIYSLAIDLGGARVVFAFDRSRMLEGAPAAYTRMPPLQESPRNR